MESSPTHPTSSPTLTEQPPKFEAGLSLGAVVAVSVSAMLGSGLFVLPGLAASMTGSSVWLAYVVAGLCVLPAALSKAELATAMPSSGGTYVYVDRTFGPLVGTILGLGIWISLLLKSAFALAGFGAYLAVVANVSLTSTSIVLLAMITALNVLGVKKVGRAQGIVVAVATLVLVCLSIWGLLAPPGNVSKAVFASDGFSGFTAAVAFVFVSFAGVTKIAAIAEEVDNPTRNLPRGMLYSLGAVTFLYGLVVYVMTAVIDEEALEGSLRPVHLLGETLGGPIIGFVAAILGVVTMTSMANAGLLASSRFPFAMARDGLLPPFLHRLHPRYLTPTTSIITTAFLMGIVILTLDVTRIAKLASVFILINYLFDNLSVLVLRETNTTWYSPKYKTPLYPVVPIVGSLLTLYLIARMGTTAFVATVAVAIPGALVFAVYGRLRTERKGVLEKRGRRFDLEFGRHEPDRESGASATQAKALVALLGHERSPETLVEMGAALADHGSVRVELIIEVPDQTAADEALEDSSRLRSLRRRLTATAEAVDLSLDFETLSTRDVLAAIHRKTKQLEADWLVLGWRARSRGSFVSTLPLGWLTQRLSCNLAIFGDAGVRHMRKILAFVEPGPHDALVASTADHLAEINGAQVTLACFLPEDAELPLLQAQTDYLEQLGKLIAVPSRQHVLRGESEAATLLHVSESYDLMVLGAPPEKRRFSMFRPSLQELLHEKGACSVLSLRTPRTRSHERGLFRRKPQPGGARPNKPSFALLEHLDERFLEVGLDIPKKDALFDHFAETFAAALPEIEASAVAKALWERENTQNTSVGDGIAMPHATLREADALRLGIFVLDKGMNFEAIDGKPVDVFFVTIGPPNDRTTHLRVLGKISELVLGTKLLEGIRASKNATDVQRAVEVALRESEAVKRAE
ncbi:MAG: amino acid permease [Planctomycetes bacterium]|nr:amino acid permease [Planctomycetota bacterium]